MILSDALTAVEGAQSSCNNAAAQTRNDTSPVAAIQAKLDAAAFNQSLDDMIAGATAAKIPVGV
jgi:hypothetical protein